MILCYSCFGSIQFNSIRFGLVLNLYLPIATFKYQNLLSGIEPAAGQWYRKINHLVKIRNRSIFIAIINQLDLVGNENDGIFSSVLIPTYHLHYFNHQNIEKLKPMITGQTYLVEYQETKITN